MPAPARPQAPPGPAPALDDDLDELPPLDDEAAASPEADVGPLLEDEAEDASLDDATGEDDPQETDDLDVDDGEGGWLDEPAETPDLALGDDEPDELQALAPGDVDEPGVEGETFDLIDGPEHGGLDGGDEGPVAEDEELREQDLPSLDADDEGEPDDAALVDAGFASDEPAGLPWAARPWSRVGAPIPLVSATALACAGRGAIVAGRLEGGDAALVRVDLEGAFQVLAAEGLDVAQVRSLQVQGDAIVAALEGAAVARASRDGGAAFQPAGEGMQRTGVAPARPPGTTAPPEARAPLVAAQRGKHGAYAARAGGVAVRAADGPWTACPWAGAVTALAFVDDQGTLLAATYSDVDDTTALVRVDPQGRAAVVARVGPTRSNPESDGRVVSMAHDAAHDVVWVAGGFGVAVFSAE